jgi:peptidoglycan-N-acetylmuramic acid deacetylase
VSFIASEIASTLNGGILLRKIVILCIILVFVWSLATCVFVWRENQKTGSLPDLGGLNQFDVAAWNENDEVTTLKPDDGTTELVQGSNSADNTKGENPKSPSVALNVYSNKTFGWGLVRNKKHIPPEVPSTTVDLLKKYGALYVGDTSKKVVYLTFDEGYENGYTAKILDVLKADKVKAVFFITGGYMKNSPDLVKRMVDEGQMVGNHSINHPSLPSVGDSVVEEEIVGLERVFKEKYGKDMKLLRPPKGEYSERTLAITKKLGYTNVFWSFAYDDWYRDKIRGAQYARDIVLNNSHNGAIILLHAVSKDNAEALDMIIKGLASQGYSIGDPEKLIVK